jgi:hypothetical protein
MPTKRANDLPTAPLQHELTLEGVPFLFARIELALPTLRTLNGCFRYVHHHHLRFAKSSHQLFLACQAKLPTLHQMVFHPAHNAVDRCLTDAPTTERVSGGIIPPEISRANVKVAAIFSLLIPGTLELYCRGLTWVWHQALT